MIDRYHFDKTPEDAERDKPAENLADTLYFSSSERIDLQHNYLLLTANILYNRSV
jgi:hypothetical protein